MKKFRADAQRFIHPLHGEDVDTTFERAREEALTHWGQTKEAFVVIQDRPLTFKQAAALAGELFDEGDPRVDDTHGPVGAIRFCDEEDGVRTPGWLFFGWTPL